MKHTNTIFSCLRIAGKRSWTASVLPALFGTTLPFWLHGPGFEIKVVEGVLFLTAVLSGHIGFSFLYFGLTRDNNSTLKRKPLFISGIFSLTVTVLIGVLLNSYIHIGAGVPGYIFIVYGAAALFTGVLYVLPPFSFHQRLFGELVAAAGLGMMPVLGAYLVQTGDIIRSVYIASLPLVVSAGLWVWITRLININHDRESGSKTTVMYYADTVPARYITAALIFLIYAALAAAVVGRSSLHPLSMTALISLFPAARILKILWKNHEDMQALKRAETYTFLIHLTVCAACILASLSSVLFSM